MIAANGPLRCQAELPTVRGDLPGRYAIPTTTRISRCVIVVVCGFQVIAQRTCDVQVGGINPISQIAYFCAAQSMRCILARDVQCTLTLTPTATATAIHTHTHTHTHTPALESFPVRFHG